MASTPEQNRAALFAARGGRGKNSNAMSPSAHGRGAGGEGVIEAVHMIYDLKLPGTDSTRLL